MPIYFDEDEIYKKLKKYLRGDDQHQLLLCMYVAGYIYDYQYGQNFREAWSDKSKGKDMRSLNVAANRLNMAAKAIANCGEHRTNMLYAAYDRDSTLRNHAQTIIDFSWDNMARDLEGLERLASYCGEVSKVRIDQWRKQERALRRRKYPESTVSHIEASAESVLLARTGIKARELKVLGYIGKTRGSHFYNISREILTFIDIHLKYPDDQVQDAVKLI